MRSYALTYPQLINQAIATGMSDDDLARLKQAYEFTERMTDGLYRAQGVPFSCHLVRCGSIVMATRQPVHVVMTAMVHAAYRLDRFRDSRRRRFRPGRGAQVRRALGEDVERLLSAYEELPWYSTDALDRHLASLDDAGELTRQALVMRLGDELDDALDLAMAYLGEDDVHVRVARYGDRCVELARRLGLPELEAEFHEVEREYRERRIPQVVKVHRNRGYERSRKHLWEMSTLEGWLLAAARRVHRRLRG
ncbi:MAG: hypothetical protein ACREK3_07930 [Gemmatimonadota bacterium]